MKLAPKKHCIGDRTYWVVRVGKRLTGQSGSKKHYFDSRGEAQQFIDKLQEARKKKGEAAFSISLELQSDALEAVRILKDTKATLTMAANHYIKTHPHGKPCATFKAFSEAYVAARLHTCTKHTLSNYRCMLKRAHKEFGETPINQITQTEIEEWAAELECSGRTITNILDTITTIFNDAVRKELVLRNPALHVPRPPDDGSEPGILRPEQAASLLQATASDRPYLVPAIAIALFAGVRRSELCALTQRNILLDDELLIEIPTKRAKTRKRRLINIQPNLASWLEAFPVPIKGEITGTDNPDVFGEWLRELAKTAGIAEWPHNAMRHSFASYLYALTKNENAVAEQMGNTPNVVISNYRAVVKPKAATAYFGIYPPGKKAKELVVLKGQPCSIAA